VDINWQIAFKLQNLLQKEYGIKALKTRELRDRVMSNEQRAEFANKSMAPLVIRLHCDTGKSSGFTVYYPDRQGAHDGKTGPDPKIISSSRSVSRALHAEIARELKGCLRDRGIKGESRTYIGSRQGALTASIFSRIPAVTVEMCFLSSRHDALFIKSPEGQQKMTRALAEGIASCLRGMESNKQ
jgi:N-acetylmuramoyl-L-alanine amidase